MKMTKDVQRNRVRETTKEVVNFMGGVSYEINPIDCLKMVSASSIFGEPAYYRDGEFAEKTIRDGVYKLSDYMIEYTIEELDKYKGMATSELMEKIIDEALDYNFKAVLDWAVTLREEYFMRLNPQIIMVRAALHGARQRFTTENPGYFNDTQQKVMSRGDDIISQITYILYLNKSKNKIPSILKRSWAKKVSSLSRYELYKYRNHGIGLIDTIRICHATGKDIDELMKTGTISVDLDETTWENLRANGSTWLEIMSAIKIPHMALLRNLRGIFTEIEDMAKCKEVMESLKGGVLKGKQFPFRYLSAVNAIEYSAVNHKAMIKDGLEECIDTACQNLPKLAGKNAFLSDNSGSAWGTCPSEYGTVTIAEIGNLSATIGAANSDEGYVFPFGDELKEVAIGKRQGILEQSRKVTQVGRECGMSTECGIWLFFDKAITNKEHWDNIFIYSDMQAGHGELYGTTKESSRYMKAGYGARNGIYINVPKLINEYRTKVNPKVNIYCIQTAGYNNVLVPEYAYRCNILYGWTGKELLFADAMNKFWDEKDSKAQKNK